MSFQSLHLSAEILSSLTDMGFVAPTPIQSQVIPLLMQGKDVIGHAQTGTGKTAAFGIPILEMLSQAAPSKHKSPDALILTPTRELANQVSEEIRKLGKHQNIKTLPIYGGTSLDSQIQALKKRVHIVVGTPGRVIDHIERGTLDLSHIQFLVLDEADEMLDMGFIDDILFVLKKVPPTRQMLMFSATMPQVILGIAEDFMNNPQQVSISNTPLTVPKIEQGYYKIEEWERFEALCRVLDSDKPDMTIIFCQTKKEVDELHRRLTRRNYASEALHGDFSQFQRDKVMQMFRDHALDILIATDLAARGIDVSNVSMVVNYTPPQNAETYVHRIGRTGRAGRTGKAITFVSYNEMKAFDSIQRFVKLNIPSKKLPTEKELFDLRKLQLQQTLEKQSTDASNAEFVDLASQLLEKSTPVESLAAVLRLAYNLANPAMGVDQEGGLSSDATGAEKGMVRFFLSAGKKQNLSTRDILRAITRRSTIPGDKIGRIRIQEDFTFLEVQDVFAQEFQTQFSTLQVNQIEMTVKPAKNRDRMPREGGGGRQDRFSHKRSESFSGKRESFRPRQKRVSNG